MPLVHSDSVREAFSYFQAQFWLRKTHSLPLPIRLPTAASTNFSGWRAKNMQQSSHEKSPPPISNELLTYWVHHFLWSQILLLITLLWVAPTFIHRFLSPFAPVPALILCSPVFTFPLLLSTCCTPSLIVPTPAFVACNRFSASHITTSAVSTQYLVFFCLLELNEHASSIAYALTSLFPAVSWHRRFEFKRFWLIQTFRSKTVTSRVYCPAKRYPKQSSSGSTTF